MTYLILNPNGKKVADILRSWQMEFVEVREGNAQSGDGAIAVSDASDWRALECVAARLHFERTLRGVISCHESTMLGAAFLRAIFDLPGPSFDQTVPFVNKHVMKTRVAASGIPIAAHALLQRSRLEAVVDSVVVKPISSASCIGTRRYCASEARAISDAPPDGLHVLEEAIDVLTEYHVDSIFESGATRWVGSSRYLRPPISACGGAGIGSVLLDTNDPIHQTLTRLNSKVVQTLGLGDGVFHAEFMQSASGEIFFGEIAARPGGAGICSAVRYACGVDLQAEHLRISLHPEDRAAVAPCRLQPRCDGRYVGWVILPVRSGRIRSLTARAEIEARPSVITIEQHLQVGNRVEGEDHPYRGAYTVFLGLASPQAFVAECEDLLASHHCEME